MDIPSRLREQSLALCGLQEDVAWVRLNRINASHLVDVALADELRAVWSWLSGQSGVPTVVVTGVGPEIFTLGQEPDLRGQDLAFTPRRHGVRQRIVAAVNGGVAREGFGLLAEADVVIAARNARFSTPTLPEGTVPTGDTAWLSAIDWSKPVDAQAAKAAGLVHEIVDLASLKEVARAASAAHAV
jgi:enoyl-CoA hydratase